MKATIRPSRLAGTIPAVASKSQAHRLLICAALADRETVVRCSTDSADITATAEALNALGAKIERTPEAFLVKPIVTPPAETVIDAGESGSTLRFLLPVTAALGVRAAIVMHGRLASRPLSPLWEQMQEHGAVLTRPANDALLVSGRLTGGQYRLAGNVSSQFISGLLFALPLTHETSRIDLEGELESADYVLMTRLAQSRFGVRILCSRSACFVSENERYVSPGELEVEGDWSNAAFWICAGRILGGGLTVTGLSNSSPQGDRAVQTAALRIASGGAEIDCRNIPDLVPILSVLASVSPKTTRFYNASRLRLKESDRLKTTAALLSALGGEVEETEDGLLVTGVERLRGGEVSAANDHRIAMSAAVASLACREPVILHGAEAVNKSYPAFWDDFERLGGVVDLEDEV